ncbi:hypothetical protein E2L08_05555 [Palleronia sediminis]|uniref:Uncharacterized protein n=1 Tax=Palleronia sediminis TaxID=2547833 RepID=A0A4R6AJI8_9RHOB|nr:hypothetical protein [Palleronia sediminis]TDL81583.1 hypothetical protein E2L08_05555 [Palleronia sediminis]
MRRRLTTMAVALALVAPMAQAACFVDYKAKRDDPLRLHYGVMRLAEAECDQPERAVAARIAVDGWQLLAIEGQFDRRGAETRKEDAGAFYLRY